MGKIFMYLVFAACLVWQQVQISGIHCDSPKECNPQYYVYPPGSMVRISKPIFVPSGYRADSLYIIVNDDFVGKSVFRYPNFAECTSINGNRVENIKGLAFISIDTEPSGPGIYTSNIYDSLYKEP